MGLIASLPEIDKRAGSVFVMHEKSEKLIPNHVHTKDQLSYVEGGIAYITIGFKTYIVPARHYFWIPQGMEHIVRIGHSATVFRSLYFYVRDVDDHPFYKRLGIYPAGELLIQMINYTECWDGQHVDAQDWNFEFLTALKNMLPKLSNNSLPIVLPITEDERMQKIIKYMERNMAEPLSLKTVSMHFHLSERSLSRLFQSTLHISFLQYLKTVRMIKAIEMILKTKKTITEISLLAGYRNIGSFSNAFHEFTQARPSDFRLA